MKRATRSAASLLLAIALMAPAGCGTIFSTFEKDGPIVYSGTRLWASTNWTPHKEEWDLDDWIYITTQPLFALVDIPLCVVFDTLILPFTIPAALGASHAQEEKPRPAHLWTHRKIQLLGFLVHTLPLEVDSKRARELFLRAKRLTTGETEGPKYDRMASAAGACLSDYNKLVDEAKRVTIEGLGRRAGAVQAEDK